MDKSGTPDTLTDEIRKVLRHARDSAVAERTRYLGQSHSAKSLNEQSIFDEVPKELQKSVLELAQRGSGDDPAKQALIKRATGSLVGMAVADGLGHNFEFLPVCDQVGGRTGNGPHLKYPAQTNPAGEIHRAMNSFSLLPGQWTDDASMGLCVADSLLLRGGYCGKHLRTLFLHWWYNGFNNAFRRDDRRDGSVGLGGNIANSFSEIGDLPSAAHVPPRVASKTEDAGNGSLMRLAAVPLFFHADETKARAIAYEHSLSTHPSAIAGEACAFVAGMIVEMLHRPVDDPRSASEFVEDYVAKYEATHLSVTDPAPPLVDDPPKSAPGLDARETLRRLLKSNETEESTERCWNWRSKDLGLEKTVANRGSSYNGYPVSAGYFGSYSMDAVAMALHCLYHTSSFDDAIVKCINFCGDADTTGSIAAQMAGAFYGIDSLNKAWVDHLHEWDEEQIELRAICLIHTNGLDEKVLNLPDL